MITAPHSRHCSVCISRDQCEKFARQKSPNYAIPGILSNGNLRLLTEKKKKKKKKRKEGKGRTLLIVVQEKTRVQFDVHVKIANRAS